MMADPPRQKRRIVDVIYADSGIGDVTDQSPRSERIAALKKMKSMADEEGCSPAQHAELRDLARDSLSFWELGERDIDADIERYMIDETEVEADPPDTKYRPYPVAALPEPIRSYVQSAASSIGCDPSYVALPLLAVMAGAIGATRRIQIKPNWSEPAVLWAVTVGDSGTLKSPALSAAVAAVEELQRREFIQYKRDIADYEAELDAREKKDRSPAPNKPIMPTLYISDATVEAIAVRLIDTPRGLLLYRDELSGWLASHNQYRHGHGGDEAAWLAMHGARPLRVDRKTGDRPTIYVPYAAVSICGSIQPDILRGCVAGANTANGMLARMLLAWPPRPKRKLTDRRIDPVAARCVHDIYRQLIALGYAADDAGVDCPVDIPLTPEAYRIYDGWFNDLAARQQQATGAHAAALSKIEGLAARLALVIQLAVDPGSRAVEADAMTAGVTLARWQLTETARIYAMLGVGSPADREASDLVAVIERLGGAATLREIRRASARWHTRSEDLERAVYGLVGRGVLRGVDVLPTTKGGRPGRRYMINSDHTIAITETPKNPEKNEVMAIAPKPNTKPLNAITPQNTQENRVSVMAMDSDRENESEEDRV